MLICLAVICVVLLQGVDALCAPSRVNCRSNNSYTFCVDLGYTTVKLESVTLKCPDGLFCSEKHYYPCVPESEVPPIGGLPEPVATTTPVVITTTQETVETTAVTTKTINQTLISPTQSQTTTLTPPTSTIYSTDTVPSMPPSQSPTTTPTIIIHTTITPTLTTISIINSTTAVPPIINSTLIPSTTNPSTLIPSTQSQSTSIGDNQTTIVPVVTESSPVPTTQVPTLPPCPNPPPGVKPMCQRSGSTYPGPICTRFYECVPIWLRLEAEERICAKGRAYSVSQRKCVIPPDGCICAN